MTTPYGVTGVTRDEDLTTNGGGWGRGDTVSFGDESEVRVEIRGGGLPRNGRDSSLGDKTRCSRDVGWDVTESTESFPTRRTHTLSGLSTYTSGAQTGTGLRRPVHLRLQSLVVLGVRARTLFVPVDFTPGWTVSPPESRVFRSLWSKSSSSTVVPVPLPTTVLHLPRRSLFVNLGRTFTRNFHRMFTTDPCTENLRLSTCSGSWTGWLRVSGRRRRRLRV